MKKTLSGVMLFLGFLSTQAQNQIKFEEYDLDNGLHVILHQDKSTPIVAVTVLYHVGCTKFLLIRIVKSVKSIRMIQWIPVPVLHSVKP